MAFLVDTSVLGRLVNRADVSHPVATAAIAELHRRGEALQITSQNLIEFRNFATTMCAHKSLRNASSSLAILSAAAAALLSTS